MCSLVSGLSQASGIRLVYEPAYTKSKQFITADFPWSRLAVAPLPRSYLPAPTAWGALAGASPSSCLTTHHRLGVLSLSSCFSHHSCCKVALITTIVQTALVRNMSRNGVLCITFKQLSSLHAVASGLIAPQSKRCAFSFSRSAPHTI